MDKDAYWFPHDGNARHDPRLTQLKMRHGMAAIGIWWNTVEMLREATGYQLPNNEATFGTIAYEGLTTPEDATAIIDYCCELGLLERSDEFFWSPSLLRRMENWEAIKAQKSERAAAAARKRWDAERENADAMQTHSAGMQSDARTGEDKTGEDKQQRADADAVIDYLNAKAGKAYRKLDSNRRHITARLADGYTVDDCKRVVDIKCAEWKDTDMEKHLNCETLFRPSKFDKYLNQGEPDDDDELNIYRRAE